MGIDVEDEKSHAEALPAPASLGSSPSSSTVSIKDPDETYRFLKRVDGGGAGSIVEAAGKVNLAVLRRKIDWHIVPLMFLCYTMQFMDKVALNYAAVMGLVPDLKLHGNDFSNASSAFFIAFLIAEIPNGYILNKISAAKWLGANVVLWGIATACTAATHSYNTLLAVRIFLGIFEAAVAPSLVLISSQWYTRSEQAPRFSFWYCGLGAGQILGGLVSFGFQRTTHYALAGWRIMFLVVGLVTILLGCLIAFFIPDSPIKAKFVTDTEKVALFQHIASNQTGVLNRHFKVSQIVEMLRDPQIYFLVVILILASTSSGVITSYSATLIKNFGFSPPHAALLNMPSGVVSIAATLVVGYGIRHTSHRWAWMVAVCIPGVIGGSLMSFLPLSNRAGLLAGIYLVNTIVASMVVVLSWSSSNIAGHSKRAATLALVTGSFSVGNIIGPQTFQARDAPQYYPAKITVVATQAAASFLACVLFLYYRWCNSRRAASRHQVTAEDAKIGQWENLTDKENQTFFYVY